MTPVEQIKDKLDLTAFLKNYLELKPAGKNQKALCPFHKEKTPSFMVSPDRQIWHCFGCGEGGDIFKFLMRYENLEFYEALRVLAEKAGVDLKTSSSGDQRQLNTLYEVVAAAKDIYQLKLRESKKAIEYLKSRNLTGETVKEFEVGFAPISKDDVTVALLNKGFKVDDVMKAGLALKNDQGKYIDRFRGRIMFTIHNHFGKPVGFSGRVLPGVEDTAKYINTPETPLFNKSRLLYGFWQSKRPVKETNTALLVEGQMDFLQLWQRGIQNVVATSGTSLTRDHLRSLGRVAEDLVVAFDKDDAGLKAAERVIDMAGSEDFNVRVLDLGKYKDPAEAAEEDLEFLKKALGEARPAMEHYFEYYLNAKAMASVASKKSAVRQVLSKIGALSSGVERAHWLRELSYRVGTPEKDLSDEMEVVQDEVVSEGGVQEPEDRKELSRKEIIAERIVYLANKRDDLRERAMGGIDLMPDLHQRVLKALNGDEEATEDIKRILDYISLHPGFESRGTGDVEERELATLLKELEFEHLHAIKDALRKEVLIAEKKGDAEKLEKKLKEFDDISRKMQHIRHAQDS